MAFTASAEGAGFPEPSARFTVIDETFAAAATSG